MGQFDLVIFDCDDVLVDSERLAVRTEAEILTGLGWPLSEADIVERFVGRSAAYMHQEIERHLGRSVDWDLEFEVRYRKVFERELAPVPGVVDALGKIPTNLRGIERNPREDAVHLGDHWTLRPFRWANLQRRRGGTRKASPRFLYAATKMDVTPERCAVIEDSASGVTAGLAAGMAVFAFAGGVTGPAQLSLGDAVVFDKMRDLPKMLLD